MFLAMLGRYWKYLGEKSNRLILVDSSELFLEHLGVYFPLSFSGFFAGFPGIVVILL